MMNWVAVTDTAGDKRLIPNPTTHEMALKINKNIPMKRDIQADVRQTRLLWNTMSSSQNPFCGDQCTSADEVTTGCGG
jgi:hypothetical protein